MALLFTIVLNDRCLLTSETVEGTGHLQLQYVYSLTSSFSREQCTIKPYILVHGYGKRIYMYFIYYFKCGVSRAYITFDINWIPSKHIMYWLRIHYIANIYVYAFSMLGKIT